MGQAVDLDDVLARTVRLLSQLTSQVAVIQYPTMSTSRVRHIEVLALGAGRVMTVLIADGGRVDQRLIDLVEPADEAFLAEVRTRLNAATEGRTLDEATTALRAFSTAFPHDRRAVVEQLAATLIDQATVDRHDRLVMAGAANLARTEPDFPGSITPVLEAIEEQVTLLRLFREMEIDQHGVAVRIGHENDAIGLVEASVLAGEYATPGGVSRVGVLGPTRMDYSTNIAAVRAVARYLSKLLGEQG